MQDYQSLYNVVVRICATWLTHIQTETDRQRGGESFERSLAALWQPPLCNRRTPRWKCRHTVDTVRGFWRRWRDDCWYLLYQS